MEVLVAGNAGSLSDVACYEVLDEKRNLYGRQRLFGTIGWALVCLLSGYLSNLATGDEVRKDYAPGYYIMTCLLLIDIFILCKMLSVKMKLSTNICRDMKKVFHSSEIILFAIGPILIGSFAAIISYYELWYLQDLGASQSLLGWAIIVQCLIAEASPDGLPRNSGASTASSVPSQPTHFALDAIRSSRIHGGRCSLIPPTDLHLPCFMLRLPTLYQ
ncbi:hypothetical protein AVEN_94350-1 [Araneus ventricosus]|uniref:Major facilitator superfamily associated domain-containing protein n=1 Tax=Araneus ventricosus TaxID=182803 RepID=A0A4Y2EDH7_ARAVE|nr:hypothetical protein AVEN_94350-1 [Araneus ventricosus]